MATHPHSLLAYQQIKQGKLLSKTRFRVYELVVQEGPILATEVNRRLMKPGESNPSYHRRLDELGDLGVIERVGEGPDLVTGKLSTLWAATENLPRGKIEHRGVPRPNAKELKLALSEVVELAKLGLQQGRQPGQELLKTLRWLSHRSKVVK